MSRTTTPNIITAEEKKLIASLEEVRDRFAPMKQELDALSKKRDALMLELHARGFRPTDIAQSAGVTMPYLYYVKRRDES